MNEPEIGQEISLAKNGDKRQVVISNVNENEFQMGGTYAKSKVEAETETGREMKIVLKDVREKVDEKYLFPGETKDMSSAEIYLHKWNILRQKEIPTVSSLRIVDRNTIAMGDMTADGSKFFGKDLVCRANEGEYIQKRPLTNIEDKYLSINPREINAQIYNLFMDAWSKGVILPYDDEYDLVVHPDGSWNVLVLDLTNLRPRRENDRLADFKEEIDDICTDVDVIRKYLLKIKA